MDEFIWTKKYKKEKLWSRSDLFQHKRRADLGMHKVLFISPLAFGYMHLAQIEFFFNILGFFLIKFLMLQIQHYCKAPTYDQL